MGKFCGYIGCSASVDKGHGIWEEEVIRHKCYGDILRSTKKIDSSSGVNDNVILSNKLSIVMDSFIMTNIPSILYIEVNNTQWKVSSVDMEYPRLILTTGGVYNGEQT